MEGIISLFGIVGARTLGADGGDDCANRQKFVALTASTGGATNIEYESTGDDAPYILYQGVEYPSPFTETVAAGDTYELVIPDTLKFTTFKCTDTVSGGDLTEVKPSHTMVINGNSLAFTGDLTGLNPSYRLFITGTNLAFTGDLTGLNPSYQVYINGANLAFTGDLTGLNPSYQFLIYGTNLAFTGDLTGLNPSSMLYIAGANLTFTGDLTGLNPSYQVYIIGDSLTFTGDLTGLNPSYRVLLYGANHTFTGDLTGLTSTIFTATDQATLAGDGSSYNGTATITNCPLLVNWYRQKTVVLTASTSGATNIEYEATDEAPHILYQGVEYPSPFTETVAAGDTYELVIPDYLKFTTFKCTDTVSGGDLTEVRPSHTMLINGDSLTFTGDLTGLNPSYQVYISGTSLTFTGDLTGLNPSYQVLLYGANLAFTGDLTGLNPSYRLYINGANLTFTGDLTGLTSAIFTATDQATLAGDGSSYTGTVTITNCPLLVNWDRQRIVALTASTSGAANIEYGSTDEAPHILYQGVEYPSPFTETVAAGDTYELVIPDNLKFTTFKCTDTISGGDLTEVKPSHTMVINGTNLAFTGDLTGLNPSHQVYISGNSLTFTGDLTGLNPSYQVLLYGNSLAFTGDLTGLNPSYRLYINGANLTFTGDLTGLTSTIFTATDQATLAGDGSGYTGTATITNCPLLVNW